MNKLFVLYSCVYSKVSLKESLRLFFYCFFPVLCIFAMMDSHTEHSQSAVYVNAQFPTFFFLLLALCDVRGGPVVKIWSITGPHKE